MSDRLSGSEAVFGFMSWLTTRKGTLKIGSAHDCNVVAGLIGAWCKSNNLAEPRDKWEENLVFPNCEKCTKRLECLMEERSVESHCKGFEESSRNG